MDLFSVDQIDHVELLVPDRHVAAKWYSQTLGLQIVPGYASWAEDPRGPLMIGSQSGNTKLALFEGTPVGSRKGTGFHRVAFRVSAKALLQFLERLPKLNLKDEFGHLVMQANLVDHDCAFSIYFCDPYGNYLELTTYDYEAFGTAIAT